MVPSSSAIRRAPLLLFTKLGTMSDIESKLNASLTIGSDASIDRENLTDRRQLLRGALGLSTIAVGTSVIGPINEALAAVSAVNSFAIAVLPDTQFYARYATTDEGQQYQKTFGSTPYAAQTGWIAASAAKYNIPFVIHLGDVVDQVGKNNQWIIADAAMKLLETAKVPYSILAGNHDVLADYDYHTPADQGSGTDAQRDPSKEPYLKWFPASRAARQPTFRGRDSSGFHEYHIFEVSGVKFLVLSLSWRISNTGIAWARKVIADNPSLPVILANHQLLNIDSDGVSPTETDYGQMLWETLIKDNDQIFMTVNGHHHGAAYLRKYNNFGNEVHEMVVDYQGEYQGGNGLMRLYEVDFTNNKIDVLSFSPWVVQKPANTLTRFDHAELTDANNRFSIPVNFRKRFAGFMRFKPTGTPLAAPIVDRVRTDLLSGYKDPPEPVYKLPASVNDFPVVADTYVHWRPPVNMVDGAVVPIGGVMTDIFAGEHMSRQPLFGAGQLDDVVWTSDKHRLSSSPGSVLFRNTDRTVNRLSAFMTSASSSMNGRSFWYGYTFEAFIKLPADWAASKHAWANILGRVGRRGDVPGDFWGGDREASSVLFAISNLREVQWETVPASNAHYAQTCWSGEIIRNNWYHVAIVNDPATATTTMYVDGAPVLRNVANAATGTRSQSPPKPWILGAGWWDTELADGFYGPISEIRIVAKPIPPSLWLTARAS
jgi:hypothetical protein